MRLRLTHTPYLDAWREQLRQATDGRGTKTELARFMAEYRSQPLHTWRVGIGRILTGHTVPNGDDVLAINHWLATRTAPDPPAGPRHRVKRKYS